MEKVLLKAGDILLRCEGFHPFFGWESEESKKPYFVRYKITKVTPTGMWIVPEYGNVKPKFQKAEKCRHASRTEAEAVLAFHYRRKAWLRILHNNLHHAQQGLADAEAWLKRTKLEINSVTTASP